MKAISLKLDEKLLDLLDQMSRATHISKSMLVRRGIELILHQMKEDVISTDFRQAVDKLMIEDKEALKRLAKM